MVAANTNMDHAPSRHQSIGEAALFLNQDLGTPATVTTEAAASADVLRSMLDDSTKRDAILEWVSLASFLEYCVVPSSYKVTDAWTNPIKLSDLGNRVAAEVLKTRKSLRTQDVKLGVALSIGCAEGLFIDPAIDVSALRRELSGEILKRRIYLPYIFGRELHDLAAKNYPAKTRLSTAESVNLLKQLPIGVFQRGFTVSGPYGCLTSAQPRAMAPTRIVPGYYCSVASCTKIHGILLHTGDTSVARARNYIRKYIEQNLDAMQNLNAVVVREADMRRNSAFEFSSSEALFETLADGFSVEESRAILDLLLRSHFRTAPEAQKELSKQLSSVISNPSEFVSNLSRPQILQILLTFTDVDVIGAVDQSLRTGAVGIGPFERRTRKNSRFGVSRLGSQAEVGSLGLRFTSAGDPGAFVGQRLLSLMQDLYFTSGVMGSDELAYQLGVSEGSGNATDLLNQAVLRMEPDEILERLVLGNRRAAEHAASILDVGPLPSDRNELCQLFKWKLGLPSPMAFDDLTGVEKHITTLRSLLAAGNADNETVRGHLSNLFTSVESALFRALTYSAWCLTRDPFASDQGFLYDPSIDASSLQFLIDNAPASDSSMEIDPKGKSTLVPLVAAFSRLAAALANFDAESTTRRMADYPIECRLTQRPFAFTNKVQFFNLSESARANVLRTLGSVAREMSDRSVISLRNSTLHGNNEFPSSNDITIGLAKLQGWADQMAATGLYPQVFTMTGITKDGLGRSIHAYSGQAAQVTLAFPSWVIAPKMPSRAPTMLIFRIAETVASGPLRYRVRARPGGDPYWEGYPRRWRVDATYGSDRETDANDSDGLVSSTG